MITVVKAGVEHVEGIARVCIDGNRATYQNIYSEEHIERVIHEFYNLDRIRGEVQNIGEGWDGYYVALEAGKVVGAIGGGMIGSNAAEVYVLYLDPDRRGEGIGTMLLEALTEVQKAKGAINQWVSVAKGNQMGIPFYEARGFQFVQEQPDYGNAEGENYRSLKYVRTL